MADKKIQFYYLDCNGFGAVARLILVAAGKEFEDIRFQVSEWPNFKPLSPFGSSPFIKLDDEIFGESLAINSYLAKEFGFHGKSNLDALRIDQVVSLVVDLMRAVTNVMDIKDEGELQKAIEGVKLEKTPKFLSHFERLLSDNKTGYFVGDGLTLADIIVFDVATGMTRNYVDINDSYPLLQKNLELVRSHSKIGPYMLTRPVRVR